MKALVVDDDLALADVVSFTLRRAGYDVIVAHDGLIALDRWQAENPDIIFLDLNMPKLDGLNVCRMIRTKAKTPIIMLTVRGDENDIVEGLKLGADDYIVKPFSPRQLVARAEAVLRRVKPQAALGPIKAGKITLDPLRNEVHIGGGNVIRLTNLECGLLETLMINQGHILPYDTLIDNIWGVGGGDRSMLKQLVYRLRRKLENEDEYCPLVETISSVGYTLGK
jgi:DNA-binding response OmpR family regulator